MSDRPFEDSEEIPRLAAAFEACTLPRAEWTHRAHLTVALWYLSRLSVEIAEEVIRTGIQRYNAACGIVTTETSGYHETLTRFYVLVVGRFVREEMEEGDWAARANALFERYGARDLPLRHYSKERLMSKEARFGWVEPDLVPLE
jgi:hypothetical protein